MKQTPCEYIVWHGLPLIRKEIVKSMINDFGLSQNETAEKIGITPAAVSQYLSGKRAKEDIIDENVLKEIHKSTEKIIKLGEGAMASETCRLCKYISKNEIFPMICNYCKNRK